MIGMDTKNLIATSKKFGRTELPITGSINGIAGQVLTAIFAEPDNKGKFFSAQMLRSLLEEYKVPFKVLGVIMHEMVKLKKCSRAETGIYTSYNKKYDKDPVKKATKKKGARKSS